MHTRVPGRRRVALVALGGLLVSGRMNGARPGEMPIEQPNAVELVLNARTAKALSLTVPGPIMALADRVID